MATDDATLRLDRGGRDRNAGIGGRPADGRVAGGAGVAVPGEAGGCRRSGVVEQVVCCRLGGGGGAVFGDRVVQGVVGGRNPRVDLGLAGDVKGPFGVVEAAGGGGDPIARGGRWCVCAGGVHACAPGWVTSGPV
jgi:hypothetical protein